MHDPVVFTFNIVYEAAGYRACFMHAVQKAAAGRQVYQRLTATGESMFDARAPRREDATCWYCWREAQDAEATTEKA